MVIEALASDDRLPRSGFSPEDERAATRVLELIRARRPVLGATMTGSIAAGLGNHTSDLDLIVIVDGNRSPLDRNFPERPRRVDVQFLTVKRLFDLVGKVRRFSATLRNRGSLGIDTEQLALIVRILLGQDVLRGSELSQARREISTDALRQLLMSRSALTAANLSEDIHGAISAKDWATALLASHEKLLVSCDVMLAGVNDFYPHASRKFIFRRMSRHESLRAATEHAWEAWSRGAVPPRAAEDEVRQVCERQMHVASWMVSTALLDAWDAPLANVCPALELDSSGPVRSPYFGLVRLSDGLGMFGPEGNRLVTLLGARLWSLTDGRPLEQLVGDLAASANVSPEEAQAEIDSTLQVMTKVGVVRFPDG